MLNFAQERLKMALLIWESSIWREIFALNFELRKIIFFALTKKKSFLVLLSQTAFEARIQIEQLEKLDIVKDTKKCGFFKISTQGTQGTYSVKSLSYGC